MKLEDAVEALVEALAERVAEKLRAEPKPEPPDPSLPAYLDTRGAADLLGLSNKSLEGLRMRGKGPPYVRIGRLVRYETAAVKAWLKR